MKISKHINRHKVNITIQTENLVKSITNPTKKNNHVFLKKYVGIEFQVIKEHISNLVLLFKETPG